MTPHSGQIVTGNTPLTQPENRVFYPALDGLRAIALLMVFCQHYLSIPWGWTGVNIFFVLSGFLITGILYDTRDDPHRVRNFYVRRTLRIFPLYYAVFAIFFVLAPLMHWKWSLAWVAWPLYLGNFLRFRSPDVMQVNSMQELAGDAVLYSPHLPNTRIFLGHFWSLCVEEQFYLFWPWIVFFARSRRALIWICAVVVLIVPATRIYAQHHAPLWMLKEELLYRVTPFQLDSLLLGALVALLYRGSFRRLLISTGRRLAILFLACCAAYLALTILIHPSHPYAYPTWRLTWGLTFVNLLAASLILSCVSSGGFLFRFFMLRPLRWLGRISYGAYVWHDILHYLYGHFAVHLFHSEAMQHYATAGFALVGTIFISWLSFRFLETPFLNLKDRWTIR